VGVGAVGPLLLALPNPPPEVPRFIVVMVFFFGLSPSAVVLVTILFVAVVGPSCRLRVVEPTKKPPPGRKALAESTAAAATVRPRPTILITMLLLS
jgi:hypothetical protein